MEFFGALPTALSRISAQDGAPESHELGPEASPATPPILEARTHWSSDASGIRSTLSNKLVPIACSEQDV